MSFIAVNVLTVPEGAAATLESRFAARRGAVDGAEGFEGFELLRPVSGTTDYLVWTRWRTEADFAAWRDGQQFADGHASSTDRGPGARPAATGSTVWGFEVVDLQAQNDSSA